MGVKARRGQWGMSLQSGHKAWNVPVRSKRIAEV